MNRHIVAGSLVAILAGAAAAAGPALAQGVTTENDIVEVPIPQNVHDRGYSPYAGRSYPTKNLFGDTHHHTANSGDAFFNGDRLGPAQAYRFARGEEVTSSSGVAAMLSRPLDFLVITDHAEGLGIGFEIGNGNPSLVSDPQVRAWSDALNEGGEAAADATNELISAQAQGTLPAPLQDPAIVGPIMKTVWGEHLQIADRFNEPGRFTAMIGFEWTSVPGGNNLHRNIMFRDGSDLAGQIVPYTSWQSENPEKLWDWMEQYEEKTGGRLLAIPHNGNLSNGRMFELQTFEGDSLTREYAERRTRWERLQEVMQTKGNSETHPTLSPNDEFADYGIAGWEYGNLTMEGEPESPEMRPYMYLRGGLLQGLAQARLLGANPFKFGFVGGSDIHNSLTAIEEDNFFGKHVIQEPHPERWEHVSKQGFGKTRYTWHYTAAGYAVVWATENTREAIWDAMERRETYATSGTRQTVRFFGGWDFVESDLETRYLADIGYRKGVPMGSDLPARTAGTGAPTFLVAAMMDPLFGNLDRIQIIKGWLDASGEVHEQIYDVAWGDADSRRPGPDGKLPPVGNTVDVANATWKNTIGDPELAAVWTDPSFDPGEPAFYYARVIDIPTPRWTAYDALRFGIQLADDVPMVHQERAWTSPIWYTP